MDSFVSEGRGALLDRALSRLMRQHARDVKGAASGAVLDLMPARGAVGDDQRFAIRTPDSGQQRQFGHLHRGPIGVGAVAERAGHAATAGLDDFDIQFGNQPKHLFDRLERTERFLMAMAVHDGFPGDGAERQLQAAGLGLAHQKFLKQQRVGS